MRKAALVIGIICAVFAVLATVLRIVGFPGGSLLYIGFTSLFSVVSLGLHFASGFKAASGRTRRISLVIFWFGLADLQVGLLYAAMSWKGVSTILIQALVLIITALILFVISAKKPGVVTKWFSSYTIVAIIIYASLSVGWIVAGERVVFGAEHLQAYYSEMAGYTATKEKLDKERFAFLSDTANESISNDANQYFQRVDGLLLKIDGVKSNLIEESNGRYDLQEMEKSEVMVHPEEYDLSTTLLVGDDVQHPTGSGMEICEALVDYRMNDLHQGVSFVIPVSKDVEQKEQWVKDNFYHLPAIDALTRLTVIQKNIIQSAIESIEKKLFVTRQ